MKSTFYLIFSAFLLLSSNLTLFALLNDTEKTNDMVRKGIPIIAIAKARQSPIKHNIRDLILAAAPKYPLKELLAIYPSSNGAKGGESAFFEDCTKDLTLFCQFFEAIGRESLVFNGMVFNPLVYHPQENYFLTSDATRPSYIPFQLMGNSVSRLKYMTLIDHLTLFKPRAVDHVNFPYILKLLETDLPVPSLSDRKNNKPRFEQLKWLRVMAPLIRGQLALREEHETNKALEFFNLACQRNPRTDLKAFLNIHMAEIYLGVAQMTASTRFPNLLDEAKGVTLLENSNNPFAKLRLGQYYLGFFGHKVNEEKGLPLIKRVTQRPELSHLAYRALAEYKLGVTNPDALDLPAARQLLNQTFRASDGIKDLEVWVHLRRAEIAMGIFTEDSDLEENPVDIPEAIRLLNLCYPDGLHHLHRIYLGHFGGEFKDQKMANRALDKLQSMEGRRSPYFDVKRGIKYLKDGDVQSAVKCFKRHYTALMSQYYLGCIYSNPQITEFYDPNEAFYHLMRVARYNFRDAGLRATKLYLSNSGYSLTDNADIIWFTNQIFSGKIEFFRDELEARGFNCDKPAESKEPEPNPEQIESGNGAEDEELIIPEPETDEIQEDSSYIRQELDSLDPEAPIRSLSDPVLQDLYDNMGHTIKWKKLLKVVQAFGGDINMERKQIKFPNSDEVFTFHLPHSGNPSLTMSGYWSVLKAMIDHEYNALCEQEENESEE